MTSVTELTWSAQSGFPVLSTLIVTPVLAMISALFARTPRQASRVGLLGSGVELALGGFVLARFHADLPSFQFVEHLPLFAAFSYHLGVDGINLLFVLLTALLTLLVVLYEEIVHERPPGLFIASIFAFEAVLMGLFLSLDLLQFWVFTALELLPALFILRRWSTGHDQEHAARVYRRFMGGGLVLLLGAIVLLGWNHARMTGRWSFDYGDLTKTPISESWQTFVFVLMFYACSIRLAQFPFHAWLPIVAQHGTLATVCVFVVGLKAGIYALTRFALPLLPHGVLHWQNGVVALGVAGIFYGAVLALMQLELRRLLAFAAVSNTGMLVVGVFSLDTRGLAGTFLLSINFGVAACGMLFTTGLVYRRARTTLLPRLGAMFERMPLLGLTFLIAALSTMAMPGTPGFDAAHLLLEGAIGGHDWGIAIAVAIGNVLTAAFLLRAFQRTFLAERKEQALRIGESRLTRPEAVLASIVCLVLIGVGFYTEPWVALVEKSLTAATEPYRLSTFRNP